MSFDNKQFQQSTNMTEPGDAPLAEETDNDNVHDDENGT